MRTLIEPSEAVRSLVRQAAVLHGIPGVAIVLADPGRRALLVHGESWPGSGRPVTPATWFSVASSGKHLTALAVLDLVRDGVVSLTEPVGRYLPGLPVAWAGRRVISLLRHTSGLPEYLSAQPSEPVPVDGPSFVARYGSLPLAFDEGSGWLYTNTNYILAGLLVARCRGRSYAETVQSLFDRAACPGAAVGGPAWARLANASNGSPPVPDPEACARDVIGDGDVCFTASGALRWLEILLDGGPIDPVHARLMVDPGRFATGRPSAYGCGWFVEPFGDGTLVHHGGHFDGWTALVLLNPARGCGVIAMCNLAPGHTRHIRYLAQAALEAFVPGATPLSLPVMQDDDPVLTARVMGQLLRPPGAAVDPTCLADELQCVAAHGSVSRTVPALGGGSLPGQVALVERRQQGDHEWRRFRLTHADRTEHVLVGSVPEGRRMFWAWPL